jgi:fumarylacetoacetate (FAA) hydrolase
MRLCMFHPNDNPLDRGWVGRIDGDRVLHLAAQTLQSFFLGGGGAREHAEYALADVTLLAPVQYPPTVRVFAAGGSFRFANATAVIGPGVPVAGARLSAGARVAAVIGAGGEIGGTTAMLEWHDPAEVPVVKQSDFGLVLGPTVVTPDELDPGSIAFWLRGDDGEAAGSPEPFSWLDAIALAGRRTALRPGDVIAGPPVVALDDLRDGVRLEVEGIGTLVCPVLR